MIFFSLILDLILFDLILEITVLTTSANIPFDRFGWFYDRNGSETYDGLFEMFTGEDDIYKVSFCPHFPILLICLCRLVRSAVGTRREALAIFILNPVTDLRAAPESSFLRIRCSSKLNQGFTNIFRTRLRYPTSHQTSAVRSTSTSRRRRR